MTFAKAILSVVMLGLIYQAPVAQAARRGRVLVVVSSQNRLPLQSGKSYPTGFYFNELTVPVRKLIENGYDVTFANPAGNRPVMDVHSDHPKYFGNDVAKYNDYKTFLNSLTGLYAPRRLSDVIAEGLDQFDGVFFPGGHAPMIDLSENPEVGQILRYFHAKAKPTALICHGPIALLSAMVRPDLYKLAIASRDGRRARDLARGWIYAGYKMTVFSKAEEQVAETNQLGGNVLFYPDVALQIAGGTPTTIAAPWQNNVVRDRELITGQNPFSDDTLAEIFLTALKTAK